MAPKNNTSITARSKATDAKSIQEIAHVATNIGAIGPMTRNIMRTSTQSSMEVPSASTPVFGLTSPNGLLFHNWDQRRSYLN